MKSFSQNVLFDCRENRLSLENREIGKDTNFDQVFQENDLAQIHQKNKSTTEVIGSLHLTDVNLQMNNDHDELQTSYSIEQHFVLFDNMQMKKWRTT
jgi:hypothetical protein